MSMTKAKKSDGRESEARRLRRELFTDEMLDQLMAATDERGLSLTGEGGFLPEMIKVTPPGVSGDFESWEGWSYARRHAQAVPA